VKLARIVRHSGNPSKSDSAIIRRNDLELPSECGLGKNDWLGRADLSLRRPCASARKQAEARHPTANSCEEAEVEEESKVVIESLGPCRGCGEPVLAGQEWVYDADRRLYHKEHAPTEEEQERRNKSYS
jgi:hypothetical protein